MIKQVNQKQPTLQDIINKAQTGGGEPVDAYTKAEADAKFQTIENSYNKAEADAKYQTIAGMSGYVPMSTNYFTVNGIRVYVSATAPSGDIPEGSIGLGW